MYTFESLINESKSKNVPMWEIILLGEHELTDMPEEQILSELERRYEIMCASANKALNKPLHTAGELITGYASNQNAYTEKGNTLCGNFINHVMAHALSCSEVNAAMGRICACPTAGSCGIVPAVLCTLEEERNIPREKIIKALLLASGFGAIVTENATVAGAEGGCQVECGVAAAMASAAAVFLMDGTDEQCINAFSISLMNVMGLVCDPIAGLVQIPCAQRNASQAVNALLSADLALGGMTSPIPPDEMVEALRRVGRDLPPSLRETAMGGIAATPAARKIERKIFNKDEA